MQNRAPPSFPIQYNVMYTFNGTMVLCKNAALLISGNSLNTLYLKSITLMENMTQFQCIYLISL